jgi:hypothetical protein
MKLIVVIPAMNEEQRDLSQRGRGGFDIVTIYADPTGTVPTPSVPGSSDRVVRSMVFAMLPHFT